MPNGAKEYSIQEASELLGVPIQKLRRWDDQGVLSATRTAGGHRRYPRELVDRLAACGVAGLADHASEELATVKRSLAEKRRVIQLLVESERRYRDLVETSHDLVWITDAQGRFTYLNSAAEEIFGVAAPELIGRCFFDFEAGSAHLSNRRFLADLRRTGEVRHYITHLVTAGGDERWIGINARISCDEQGGVLGIRGTARDITDQHLATARIEHLALHDPLTDLPNRHALHRRIEDTTAHHAVGALLFLDIDHFKYINDNFGHRAGDQLIIGVGGVLRDVMRDLKGELYRLGGDEFALHLPDVLRRQAVEVAETVLGAVRQYRFCVNDRNVVSSLTVSIGIALYPFHGNELPRLLASADIALYQAKDLGRNRCMLFDQEADSLRSTHKRVHWARKLRDALDEDRVELFAQPVMRLKDRKPVSHEVLVRIRDEEGRHIVPAHFVELAESLGMIQEIDMRVVEKLLQFMQDHNLQGRKLRYFVNLSRASISDSRWIERFLKVLKASAVDPGQLVFEITENAAMSEVDTTLRFVRCLKDMGCRFALDHFGAGFNSFYFLKRFQVDYLKIDGSFIRDLGRDEGCRIFVRALNQVARDLRKQVIAEQVETQDALNILIRMGTQYGQGNLFRPALPLATSLDDFAGTLRRRAG